MAVPSLFAWPRVFVANGNIGFFYPAILLHSSAHLRQVFAHFWQ
jgi:hypothetical protein